MPFPTLISVSQAGKEVVSNENDIVCFPVALFGRRYTAISGLTWAWFGGQMMIDGVLTTISDGTILLSASATNFVEATRAGVVSTNTTGYTAGRIPLYTVVTGASSITSHTDQRQTWFRLGSRLSKSVAGGVDVTLTAAEARNDILEFTGTLTASINVIVPTVVTQWTVANLTSGAFTLTVKTAAGSGPTVDQNGRAILYCDGVNVVSASGASGPSAPIYDVGGYTSGKPAASAAILHYPFPRQVTFPASLTNSRGSARTAATAQTDFDIRKNAVSVGTMRFAASATTATFIAASAQTYAAGDTITVVAPGTQDTTLADIGFSLAGTR